MAEALVGGAFLSATLQVLFDRMASREVLDFFRKRELDDALLKNLKRTLLAVNAVLSDAEEKQITNPAVKEWLDELKDAVYDAEDLLDAMATDALQRKIKEAGSQTFKTQVGNVISILNPFDEGITPNNIIKNVIQNIEGIAKQKDLLGLKEGVGRKPSLSLPTTSLLDESGVFGREDDKEKLTQLLLSDDSSGNGPCVITIVGLGGVGKTTLAQLLYNDAKVNDYFDLKAWVCVSEKFDVFRVHKTVLESINFITFINDDLNLLQVKLRDSLMGKKFLIVLDDIWNDNYNDWDKLRAPFGAGQKGSKIIVTTRHQRVASVMRTVPTHYLEKISSEASWSLFAKHAFENGNPNSHPNLEKIGKKIVEKCNGLPLAIKTLGGLSHAKVDAEEWNDILKSDIWEMPNDNILPALRLSYHHLPTHLKRCFAYCSIFPKDYTFKKEKLILLWMAEGFVQQSRSEKRIEEVGDEYFCELSSRSFFQQLSCDKSRFLMHHLINDLAQLVAGEFCYRLEGDKSHEISGKVRHFSYFRGLYDSNGKFESFYGIKGLRTFLPLDVGLKVSHLSNNVLRDLLPKLRYLRVLSLSHYENIIELPDFIKNLQQLRYLDLSQTAIKKLPEEMFSLCNLQSLILSYCRSLTVLPPDIGKLINLRHLDISGTDLTEMPEQISELRSLQTLTTFVVGKSNRSRVGELREFRHLQGRLSILELQNAVNDMDAWEANLKEKKHLDELCLVWGKDSRYERDPPEEEVEREKEKDLLDNLQPSTNLKKLTINHYGGKSFPNWLGDHSFANIVVMCLSDCKCCESLPPLGQLPSLEEVSIERMGSIKNVGREFFYGSGSLKPFQKLKTLKFLEMSEWADWSFSEVEGEVFPSLQVLSVGYCPKLGGELPDHLPFLKELVIFNCEQLKASIPMHTASVRRLEMSGCKEVRLSNGVDLTSLEFLSMSEFPDITSLPSYDEITSRSSSTQVDQQYKKMPSLLHGLTCLKELKIVGCKKLSSLPETGLPSFMLQSLEIMGCHALESLAEGMIHSCARLQRLRISDCPSLKSFARGGLPTALKTLFISKCRQLELLPLDATDYYYSFLESLAVSSSCDSLESFRLGLFPKLNRLRVEDCWNLKSLRKEGLQKGEDHLTSLCELRISSCPEFVSFPEGGLPTPNLRRLHVSCCNKLKSLPKKMHTLLPSLEYLHVHGCPELKSFPKWGLPSNLVTLSVSNCNKLTACRTEWGLQKLPSLREFLIKGCDKVVSSEESQPSSSNTQFPSTGCKELESFPQESTHTQFPSEGCHNWVSSLEESLLNSSLKRFFMGGSFPGGGLPSSTPAQYPVQACEEAETPEEWLLPSTLAQYPVQGCEEAVMFLEEWLLPSTLTSLRIEKLPNLTYLHERGLQHLGSLGELYIGECPKLQCLPGKRLPGSLSSLYIFDCPLLELRCQRDKGKDWTKIAHIPCIVINGKLIS